MKTQDNLKAAFAGESQANRRYLAYADQAMADGYPEVAKLFRAVAAAETIHAHKHLRTLGEIKSTAENLEAALAGENYEVQVMYPDFMADAEAENAKQASLSFKYAWEAEKIHAGMFEQARKMLGEEMEAADYWICPVCGHTHRGSEAPEKCPICGAKRERYFKVD